MNSVLRAFATSSLAAFVFAEWSQAAGAEADKRPPNIVFILADDLGYGDLGCYGQQKFKTPNIDRLAATGMRLTQYYAGSAVCAPSRCVLMTGRHPGHAYIRDNRDPAPSGTPREASGQIPIPADSVTLAQLLHAGGYATAGFGKWGLGGLGTSGDPLRHGFDRFVGYLDQWHAHNFYPRFIFDSGQRWELDNPAIDVHEKFPPTTDWNDAAVYRRFVGRQYVPDLLAERALAFVREQAARPFLLYFPTTVPHVALQVPDDALAEFRGRWPDEPYHGAQGYVPHAAPRAAYAAMITRLDQEVGRIVDLVTELGLAERTIFVFTSDNGPADRAGGADTEFFTSAGSLRGKKGSLYEGGVRVPCIVRRSGRIAAGSTSDRVVGAEDWLPTLLALCGLEDRLPAGSDGISFAPTLLGNKTEGNDQPPRPFLYREYPNDGGQQSIRVGPWKAIRQNLLPRGGQTAPDLRIRLYNLADDPGEAHDVAAQHADVVERLERLMRDQHTPSEQFPLPALDGLSR